MVYTFLSSKAKSSLHQLSTQKLESLMQIEDVEYQTLGISIHSFN